MLNVHRVNGSSELQLHLHHMVQRKLSKSLRLSEGCLRFQRTVLVATDNKHQMYATQAVARDLRLQHEFQNLLARLIACL